METRLSKIFKTTIVTKLTKANVKISYGVIQESPCLLFCMILEEIYFSGYILLTGSFVLVIFIN